MFDVSAIRDQFPVFNQTLPKGHPVTFLDSAASAQKPQRVIDVESAVQETHYANAYRGVYRFGAQIDEELEATREALRELINAPSTEQISFSSGTTMSINSVAFGWGKKHLKAGDEILLNLMEHHANFVPWQQVAQETGAVIRFIPLTDDCRLDLSRLDEVLSEKTKLVAVTGMSNVLGTVNPIREITSKAHAVGAVVLVDGAQSVPHAPVDVQADDIDFLVFSGHKLYGPTGIGVTFGKRELLDEMDPILFGGHMIHQVRVEGSDWAALPAKFEAGTIPIVQAIALGEAVRFVQEVTFEAMHAHEADLTNYAHQQLELIPGMNILGPAPNEKGAIVSFTLDGAHPEDLAQLLDRKGVFVRHGHHCTMPLHNHLGIPASVRVSFGVYNTREDVDRFMEAMEFARGRLRLM